MASSNEVSVTTLSGYPPFCFAQDGANVGRSVEVIPPGEDSEVLQGYSWDIVRESYHAVGYTITLEVNPWARAEARAAQGEVDLAFPASSTEERRANWAFPEEAVNEASYVIYMDNERRIEWNGLQSFHGKRVGAMRGWSYGQVWDEERSNINVVLVDDILGGFRSLSTGRLDGFAGYDLAFDYELRQAGLAGDFIKSPPFGSSMEYLMGAPDTEGIRQKLEAFDEGRRLIEESGIAAEIEARWF
ncbi:MAG: substrate-binding periplasmic protein [Spirochaetia bacterium]